MVVGGMFCILLINTYLHLTTAFSTLKNTKFPVLNIHFHSYFTKNTPKSFKKHFFVIFYVFVSFFEQLGKGISLFALFKKVDLHLIKTSQTMKFQQLLYIVSVC